MSEKEDHENARRITEGYEGKALVQAVAVNTQRDQSVLGGLNARTLVDEVEKGYDGKPLVQAVNEKPPVSSLPNATQGQTSVTQPKGKE
ncbi:MAG: hypothetical protein HY574_02475 [candidate division NC10 bacterium]|nr:hypothetical protein [candidate division NC10 bacterium]